ncbi:MAG: N-acetylmuramoyl-L-alanine amidase [Streptomyces sp.]|nr:N-acetylmuramoyl-L-alanine amidase [Streptomyces sp.]
MAEPLSADRFLSLVKARGVDVQEQAGWKTHNRNKQGPWGPVHGVLLHHNAGSGQVKSDVAYAKKGSSDLPGPLYAGLVAPDGTLHMVGWGRVNHAGKGDGDVLRAVIAETATLPPDNQADTDGNRHFYGFSFITKADGSTPITREAQQTMALVAYVICEHHNWTERSVIAHADWQPGKPDPAPHPSIRRQVQALVADLQKAGAPGEPPQPPEAPSTIKELTEVVEQLTERVKDLENWRNWRG